METAIFLITAVAVLVFTISQSVIIFVLRKENQELEARLEGINPPF